MSSNEAVNAAGRLRLLAPLKDPHVIRRILSHLRVPTEFRLPFRRQAEDEFALP